MTRWRVPPRGGGLVKAVEGLGEGCRQGSWDGPRANALLEPHEALGPSVCRSRLPADRPPRPTFRCGCFSRKVPNPPCTEGCGNDPDGTPGIAIRRNLQTASGESLDVSRWKYATIRRLPPWPTAGAYRDNATDLSAGDPTFRVDRADHGSLASPVENGDANLHDGWPGNPRQLRASRTTFPARSGPQKERRFLSAPFPARASSNVASGVGSPRPSHRGVRG